MARREGASRSSQNVNLCVKRAYAPATRADGYRVLVDRLWPRGLAKAAAAMDEWPRELAPSTALRRWFAHDPARWAEFQRRYAHELDARPELVAALVSRVRRQPVTLLFGARDELHNNAVALREYLRARHGL